MVSDLHCSDAVSDSEGKWWWLREPLEVEVTEDVGHEAAWCVYEAENTAVPILTGPVGQALGPGETFGIPLSGWILVSRSSSELDEG